MLLQLPALQVLLPLIGAPICALLHNKHWSWILATFLSWISLAISLLIFQQVNSFGPISYDFGNWPSPIGITYKIDLLNSSILVLVSAISSIVIPYTQSSMAVEVPQNNQPTFYSVYLLCFAGLLGIAITEDIFNIYVFLEISSLATYTLIAMGKSRRSLMAGFEYLILGTIGAAFYLIGIGIIYMMTGTLNMSELMIKISQASDLRPIQAAFAFIILGLAMKIALFPLHQWLTNAYSYAPCSISAFLAATATKVGIYVLIRFLFTIFGYDFSFNVMPTASILLVLAIMAMLAGSIVAIYHDDVKRILAFSSVAQIGYIILGLSMATHAGLIASIIHIFNHAITKCSLFLIVGAIVWKKSDSSINHCAGLSKRMPLVAAAFVISSLSLIGIPLTAGFISKWYLINAAIREDMWGVVIIIIITSLMAVYYCWKVIEAIYFKEEVIEITEPRSLPLIMTLMIIIASAATIYLGIDTRFTATIAQNIAEYIIRGIPWY